MATGKRHSNSGPGQIASHPLGAATAMRRCFSAPNRLPGAAFVTRGPLLSLVPSLAREQLSEGAIFEMEWRELGRNDAQSQITAGPWRGLFSAESDDVFRVRVHDCPRGIGNSYVYLSSILAGFHKRGMNPLWPHGFGLTSG